MSLGSEQSQCLWFLPIKGMVWVHFNNGCHLWQMLWGPSTLLEGWQLPKYPVLPGNKWKPTEAEQEVEASTSSFQVSPYSKAPTFLRYLTIFLLISLPSFCFWTFLVFSLALSTLSEWPILLDQMIGIASKDLPPHWAKASLSAILRWFWPYGCGEWI